MELKKSWLKIFSDLKKLTKQQKNTSNCSYVEKSWNFQQLFIPKQKLKAKKVFVKAFLSKEDWEKEKKLHVSCFKTAQKLSVNRSETKSRSSMRFVKNHTKTRPFVIIMTNSWNFQQVLISNKNINAQKIFLKAFLSKEDWEKEKKLQVFFFQNC